MARKRQELDIVIQATNEAGPVLGKLNDQLDDTQKSATNAQKGFTGLSNGLLTLQKGVIGGTAAFVALKQAFDFAKEGVAIQKVADTFGALSESVGATAGFMDQLRTATGGAVSNLDLMQGANKILGLGLASTEDEAVKLIETAVKLGTAFGDDAATSIENFGLLLANQSVQRLDSFGISSSAVRERINELTTGTNALSREQAFLQATLEESEVAMQRLGIEGAATADQLTQLEVAIGNLFDKVKQGTGEAALTLADQIGLTFFLVTVPAANKRIEENTTLVAQQTNTYGEFLDVLSIGAVEINKLTEAEFNLIKAQQLETRVLAGLEEERQAEIKDLERITEAITMRQVEATEAADKIELAELRVAETIERSTRMREEQAISDEEIVQRTIAARRAAAEEGRRLFEEEVAQINASIQARDVQLNSAAARQLELSQTARQAQAAEATLTDELLNQASQLGISATQYALLAAATGIYTDEQIRAALETAAMEAKVAELAAAIASGEISIQGAIDSLDSFQAELAATGDSALDLASRLDQIPNNIPVNVEFTQTGEIRVPSGNGSTEFESFAQGGRFQGGAPILVGEKGPELIFPSQGGTVVNNTDTRNLLGNTSITINVNSPMMATPEAIANSVSNELGRRMRG